MKLVKIKRLGLGGFGLVDLVENEHGKLFARKTFNAPAAMEPRFADNVRRRFAREARIQSGIRHRNIVPVVYAELDADPPFYLMPAAICSLQDDLQSDKALGGEWLEAIADIVAALDELHGMRIFHRDLKPQNVLRYEAEDGSSYYAVSDFGLIAMNESRISELTTTGMGRNTDYYTAPEITSDLKQASAQSDIYSLGCILHEIVGNGPRVPCAEIKDNGEYAAILRNCTRTDPSRRFRSVRSVLDALTSIEADLPPIIGPKSTEFGLQLESGDPLELPTWRALIETVEDDEDTPYVHAILSRLRLDQIVDLCSKSLECSDRLGLAYARWVHRSNFPFERCDGIANILEVFIKTCSFDAKSDALMAMLELGTSHNRWYVERKFFNLCDHSMDEQLARRLAVELRAAADEVCRPIKHLEHSISVDRSGLHPVLQLAPHDTCR